MTAIGLRVYRVTVFHDHKLQTLGSQHGRFDLQAAVDSFARVSSVSQARASDFRSYYFQPRKTVGNTVEGIVRYGNTGFSADLIDGSTQTLRYQRQNSDVEVIPLYYAFWTPEGRTNAYAVFQSFGGRSCIGPIQVDIAGYVADLHDGARVTFQKVMPDDLAKASTRQVNKVTLHKRKAHRDSADRFVSGGVDLIDVSLVFEPTKRGGLGPLGSLIDRFREKREPLDYSGIEFDGLSADVRIGRSIRKIGIIGVSTSAGVIDVTDNVEKLNGHPTFESISRVSADVLRDFVTDIE